MQIAVNPAAFYGLYDPREDPLRDPKRPDLLRAPDAAPPELHERVKALRARVRRVYCTHLVSAPTLGSRETTKDRGFNEVEVARDYDDEGCAYYDVVVRRYARNGATYEPDAEMRLPHIVV